MIVECRKAEEVDSRCNDQACRSVTSTSLCEVVFGVPPVSEVRRN